MNGKTEVKEIQLQANRPVKVDDLNSVFSEELRDLINGHNQLHYPIKDVVWIVTVYEPNIERYIERIS